jgi:hypothetical protein
MRLSEVDLFAPTLMQKGKSFWPPEMEEIDVVFIAQKN